MSRKGVKKIDYAKRERNYEKKQYKKMNFTLIHLLNEYLAGRYSADLQELQRLENDKRIRRERKEKIKSILK